MKFKLLLDTARVVSDEVLRSESRFKVTKLRNIKINIDGSIATPVF